MSESIFNENMTSFQARSALFRAIDGKTKEEIEQLKEEYLRVLPAIMEREFELAAQGWCID